MEKPQDIPQGKPAASGSLVAAKALSILLSGVRTDALLFGARVCLYCCCKILSTWSKIITRWAAARDVPV